MNIAEYRELLRELNYYICQVQAAEERTAVVRRRLAEHLEVVLTATCKTQRPVDRVDRTRNAELLARCKQLLEGKP